MIVGTVGVCHCFRNRDSLGSSCQNGAWTRGNEGYLSGYMVLSWKWEDWSSSLNVNHGFIKVSQERSSSFGGHEFEYVKVSLEQFKDERNLSQ